ncbi:MAG: hypothetical protein KGQ41_07575 [Alphaproteobacteria bacterium]|nr:hypothetical protein [Alphaproteobacteria bacterium]
MRILLALALTAAVFTATPALACKCMPDDGTLAQKVMNDPSISVADVLVRAVNTRTHITVMDIKNLHSGGLASTYVRAKYGQSSCDVRPTPGNTTMLIKNEPDGTYSLVGDCERAAVIQHLKGQ